MNTLTVHISHDTPWNRSTVRLVRRHHMGFETWFSKQTITANRSPAFKSVRQAVLNPIWDMQWR